MSPAMVCYGIGIMFCYYVNQPATVTGTNAFCAAYHRVIRSSAEGAALGSAPRAVKERIAANETLYRCECEGWKNTICNRAVAVARR